ncbi:unnamed protein product [Rodentolepis nana]|uniref:Ovule protein n=1 Tax=Rodentolepis nana TaxID=102285 RepID=A0A0R3TK14_RODNA|nr:unnamed protein product [Rodentolepis nana]
MKQSFLNRFTRSSGFAPSGWPTDDVAEIDASANELKKITTDVIKKLALCIPSQSFSAFHTQDVTSFSLDSLQPSGNSSCKHSTKSTKVEDVRFKLNSPINHIESNGFCAASNDKKPHDLDVTSDDGIISYDVASSKENSRNFDMTDSRAFTNSSSLASNHNRLMSTIDQRLRNIGLVHRV